MPHGEIQEAIEYALVNHMIDTRQYLELSEYINEHPHIHQQRLEELLSLGRAYLEVDIITIQKLAVNLDLNHLLQVTDLELRTYAFAHYMNQQYEAREYMDYFRALSPLLVDLFRLVIKNDFIPNLQQYMEPVVKEEEDGRSIYKGLHWIQETIEASPNLIAETWKNYYGDYFNYKHYVSSSHLIKLIDDHCSENHVKQQCHRLRQIEKNIRNIVAHEAIHVSEELIHYRSHHSIEEIHYLIQEVCLMAGLDNKSQWAVLNEIDKDMKELIN